MKRVSRDALLLAAFLNSYSALSATREYAFSGPSLSGRFIIEEYTNPTPICEFCEEELARDFVGAPYLFSARLGDASYTTTNFTLVVKNQFLAFGRSDTFGLSDASMYLLLMGPSLFNRYTSTLPHDFESYPGLHYLRMLNAETGEWMEAQIDSLVAVPVLSMVRTPAGLALRWPVSSAQFVLEASASLSPAAVWSRAMDVVETVDGSFSVTIAADDPARFFRLRWSQ